MTENKSQYVLWGLAATAAATTVYQWNRQRQKYGIPPELARSPYAKELRVAIRLALQAGKNMCGYCDSKGTEKEGSFDLGIETKGRPEDFCTAIDVENENLVTQGILKYFPDHQIIGEEATGTGVIPKLSDTPTWIIDPIDGTTNFASGIPLTCVSIGLCVGSKPVMGVVYAPMTDELYLAVRGHGAYRNGSKLSKRSKVLLKDAVVCCEFGYAREPSSVDKMTNAVNAIMKHGCRTLRMIGSGVLDICYVATGRLDVVYAGVSDEGWKPWDYCAGVVVARETGCTTEAIKRGTEQEFDLYSKSIICAGCADLVEEVRKTIS